MSIQYGTTLRNNQLDQIEATVGTSAKLRLYSGTIPANCAAAITGTLLCEITLPADWMNAASGGTKTLLGTWAGTGAAGAAGGTTATHFGIWDSGASTRHVQGTVTITGGGGDLTVDNPNIAQNQSVTISSFTITAANS